jgi:hypothetical protein
MFGRKTIALDTKYNLHYMNEGSWTIVSIAAKPDVTLLEAFNFMEKVK